MPIIKSAKKRVRQSEKRRIRNKALRTFMKNLRKKTYAVIEVGEMSKEDTANVVSNYKAKVDKAWTKGLYKRNKASRLKSAIDKTYNKKYLFVETSNE